MEYISVFEKSARVFENTEDAQISTVSGQRKLGYLKDAYDVHIYHAINGEYTLNFKLPENPKSRELIESERICYVDGQPFRIKSINGSTVKCETPVQDLCRVHMPYFGDVIGTKAYEIFRKIIYEATTGNSVNTDVGINCLSTSEYKALGLEPVDDLTDFFETSKKTPIGLINILLETLNLYKVHAEVYIDGFNVGLVKSLGEDRGVILDTKYNALEITSTTDTYNLITRLYAYGKDDLPLDSADLDDEDYGSIKDEYGDTDLGKTNFINKGGTYGRAYIESVNLATLGDYDGFCNFDEVTEPEDLLLAALWQFDPDNPDRVDVPKYSASVNICDLNADVRLGDIVTIADRVNGIRSKQRVISVDIYPYEPSKNSITVGIPPVTMEEAFTGMYSATQYLRINTNGQEDLKTSTIEFMDCNETVVLESSTGEQKIAKYETGALFVSDDEEYAIALMDGKLKIGVADSTTADGWDWIGIFGHGDDEETAKLTYLYTNLVTIASESGNLQIKDNAITMYDASGTLRFYAGYDATLEQYTFELYDNNGELNLYIDDDGNLTMRGVFMTGNDGENRVIIDGNGIQSYNSSNQLDGLMASGGGQNFYLYADGKPVFGVQYQYMYGTDYLYLLTYNSSSGNLEVVFVIDGSGKAYYNGYEIATKNDLSNIVLG